MAVCVHQRGEVYGPMSRHRIYFFMSSVIVDKSGHGGQWVQMTTPATEDGWRRVHWESLMCNYVFPCHHSFSREYFSLWCMWLIRSTFWPDILFITSPVDSSADVIIRRQVRRRMQKLAKFITISIICWNLDKNEHCLALCALSSFPSSDCLPF